MRWTFALLACLGCYAPAAKPGAACPDGVCPEGLVCSPATQTCERMATLADAATGDDAVGDAALSDAASGDAPPIDAPQPPMPMLIQHASNANAAATSLSATLPALPANGRVLVMIGAAVSGSLTTVSGGGATWTHATSSLINTNIEVWYGVTDGSSATVTISRPTNTTAMYLVVMEWSNLATTSALDVARSTDGSPSPANPGSITTTNARDLLLFAATARLPNTYGTPTPGAWTAIPGISASGISQGEWYRVVDVTGTYGASVTLTSTGWEAAIVALRIAP